MPVEKLSRVITARVTSEEYEWLIAHAPTASLGVRLLLSDIIMKERKPK